MFDFNVVPMFPSKDEDHNYYLNSKVKCPNCKCIRKVKNCETYTEQESWELSWITYEVCVCPKCGYDMEET
jgi:hypothetical protein